MFLNPLQKEGYAKHNKRVLLFFHSDLAKRRETVYTIKCSMRLTKIIKIEQR